MISAFSMLSLRVCTPSTNWRNFLSTNTAANDQEHEMLDNCVCNPTVHGCTGTNCHGDYQKGGRQNAGYCESLGDEDDSTAARWAPPNLHAGVGARTGG